MNNEWLNSLRRRMEDHEEDIPDGLWDDIRDELFSGEEEKGAVFSLASESDKTSEMGDTGNSDMGQRSLLYRIGGIAAAIVLLILTMKLLPDNKTDQMLSENRADHTKDAGKNAARNKPVKPVSPDAEEDMHLNTGTSIVQNAFNTDEVKETVGKRNFNSVWRSETGNNKKETGKTENIEKYFPGGNPENPKIVSSDEASKGAVNEKPEDEVLLKEPQNENLYAEQMKEKTAKLHQKKSWMLSMLTGNASSNSAEQQFPGYASIDGKPMNIEQVWSATEYEEDPLTEILLANQSKPVEARIRHKVPVTLGLSLYYNLGKRWGIGTGLNYTKLASELHSGNGSNYIKGDQVVHYVGIPVQVNYNVIQKGRFTGYVTGGMLLEKPISGSITTNYIVNDEVKETIKEKLDHKPLQFSVNTAVGVQLKVIDKFGIYAEPGIGYHFKGENAPNTMYKEKPLLFNIKFGVRLLLD